MLFRSASSEELATSAEEMASQADQLRSTIAYFQINEETTHTGTRQQSKMVSRNDDSSQSKPGHEKKAHGSNGSGNQEAQKAPASGNGQSGNASGNGVNLDLNGGDNGDEFEQY